MSSTSFNLGPRFSATEWAARLIPGAMRAGDYKSSEPRFHRIASSCARSPVLFPAKSQQTSTLPLMPVEPKASLSPRTRNVVIVGAGGLGRNIARQLDAHPEMEQKFCGFLDDRRPSGNGILGRTSELARWSRTVFADEVILATPHDRDLTLRVLREAKRLRLDVRIALDLFGCPAIGNMERIGAIPLICLHRERQPVAQLWLKRMVDVVGAAAACLLLAPLMLLIALFVKLDSPGPVLYSAPRAGRKGRPFRCYKFRTMVENADSLKQNLRAQNQRLGPFFKLADDPRITKVGRFLRRFSLDELPQFLNVLKGEMSLVGPRPHPLDDFSGYSVEHLRRLDVTPGITGLWQVMSRQDPSFQAGLKLDVEYIAGWSLAMDLRIMLKTAGAVLRGEGQ